MASNVSCHFVVVCMFCLKMRCYQKGKTCKHLEQRKYYQLKTQVKGILVTYNIYWWVISRINELCTISTNYFEISLSCTKSTEYIICEKALTKFINHWIWWQTSICKTRLRFSYHHIGSYSGFFTIKTCLNILMSD